MCITKEMYLEKLKRQVIWNRGNSILRKQLINMSYNEANEYIKVNKQDRGNYVTTIST
jgi:hypothetical protein